MKCWRNNFSFKLMVKILLLINKPIKWLLTVKNEHRMLSVMKHNEVAPFCSFMNNTYMMYSVDCIYTPLPRSICWRPNPQYDGIWKWVLWEVMRVRLDHVGEAHPMGLMTLQKEKTQIFLLAIWGYCKKVTVYKPRSGSYQNPPMLAPWSQALSLQNWEK